MKVKKLIFIVLVVAGSLANAQILSGSQSAVEMHPNQVTEASGSYFDWGKAQNGFGYCYHWASTGAVLNGGSPVSNYNCERNRPSYFNWGRAQNGFGYCYQYTPYGVSMNQGAPQSNYNCERTRPSYYSWGRGQDGQTRCYQYTPNGVALNQGSPVSNHFCQ